MSAIIKKGYTLKRSASGKVELVKKPVHLSVSDKIRQRKSKRTKVVRRVSLV